MDVQLQWEVLDTLYRNHAGSLKQMLSRRVGRDEAQDLVHDCYLRMLERTDVAQILHPQAFVYTVAANLAVNHLAKTSVRARYHMPATDGQDVASEAPSLETITNTSRMLSIISNALDTLPETYRSAFVLNRVEGMSYVAIAKHLKISEKSVERYIAKALQTCNAALQKSDLF